MLTILKDFYMNVFEEFLKIQINFIILIFYQLSNLLFTYSVALLAMCIVELLPSVTDLCFYMTDCYEVLQPYFVLAKLEMKPQRHFERNIVVPIKIQDQTENK